MGWESKSIGTSVQKQLFIQLNEEEKIIFDCLKLVANESLDNIAIATGFSVSKMATVLLKLEMKDCVKPLPGKFFEWA
jgi:DNA processing protein